MRTPSSVPNSGRPGGYTLGYAIIAGSLCAALLLTLPLAAGPLARALGLAGRMLAGP